MAWCLVKLRYNGNKYASAVMNTKNNKGCKVARYVLKTLV